MPAATTTPGPRSRGDAVPAGRPPDCVQASPALVAIRAILGKSKDPAAKTLSHGAGTRDRFTSKAGTSEPVQEAVEEILPFQRPLDPCSQPFTAPGAPSVSATTGGARPLRAASPRYRRAGLRIAPGATRSTSGEEYGEIGDHVEDREREIRNAYASSRPQFADPRGPRIPAEGTGRRVREAREPSARTPRASVPCQVPRGHVHSLGFSSIIGDVVSLTIPMLGFSDQATTELASVIRMPGVFDDRTRSSRRQVGMPRSRETRRRAAGWRGSFTTPWAPPSRGCCSRWST